MEMKKTKQCNVIDLVLLPSVVQTHTKVSCVFYVNACMSEYWKKNGEQQKIIPLIKNQQRTLWGNAFAISYHLTVSIN